MRLPDDLMRQVKKLAAETDRSITQVLADSLHETLARETATGARARSEELLTVGGGELQPDVDLDDSARLRDLMDSGA